jgi:hypothetical protein
VLGRTAPRRTSDAFADFLGKIVASQPQGREIHVFVDNLSTHKAQAVRTFLVASERDDSSQPDPLRRPASTPAWRMYSSATSPRSETSASSRLEVLSFASPSIMNLVVIPDE